MTPQLALDIGSVAVFALTGALVASRAQLDIVGFIFVAALTAVGGGTVRDLLLGRDPVFWVQQPMFIGVATAAAVLVFFTAHLVESRYRVLLWLDAVALAIAVPAGVAVALSLGHGWPVVLIMGVVTGCLGGLMRDVVCNEVPLVLKQGEPYVTCAALGGAAALTVIALELGEPLALIACAVATFAARASALAFGWGIPVYRSRPPRQK